MSLMDTAALSRLIAELERREQRASFSPGAICIGPDGEPFTPQFKAVTSTARRKALCCSRRAGKTRAIAVGLLESVLRPPYTNVFYLTLTLKNAKRIIWGELKRLNEVFNLGGVPNESEGYLKFPAFGHDVHIYLGGVKDPGEVEKVRGPKAKFYVLDEAQSFSHRIIGPLLKDVINPALLDVRGDLWVSGTPGPLRAGYFWDVTNGDLKAQWEQHGWTWRENPHIQPGRSRAEIEEEILEENKLSKESPTYKREWCGEWYQDFDALVFRFDPAKHAYTTLPEGKWTYVVGVDIGFEDADAVCVLGWREGDDAVYLIEEHVDRKQGVGELAARIQDVYERYAPIKIVADFGGLGKKIAVEIQRRFSLPIEAADKVRKFEHIEILNDAFRRGKFLARPDGLFAEDCAQVQWDQKARVRGTLKIADDYHADLTDAVLYAFRACLAFHEVAPPPAPTEEQKLDAWEQREAERIEAFKGLEWADRDAEHAGFGDGDDGW